MASKYELAADKTVPAARMIISRALVQKYGMNETEVANYLGIAQAAVSKYLTGKYSDALKKSAKATEGKLQGHRRLINGYIKKISEGDKKYSGICVCTICSIANNFNCALSGVALKRGKITLNGNTIS
jgi:predicted transcriptional regulator